jgi:hypothetical protein
MKTEAHLLGELLAVLNNNGINCTRVLFGR